MSNSNEIPRAFDHVLSRLPVADRRQRVAALREVALRLLDREGTWEPVRNADMNFLIAKSGEFQVLHRTPFQKLPEAPERVRYYAAVLGTDYRNLPYGLDIYQGAKVLNIEWCDRDEIRIVSFRRGDWEDKFLKLAT